MNHIIIVNIINNFYIIVKRFAIPPPPVWYGSRCERRVENMFLKVFGVGVGASCLEKHQTVRNEKSKHRNHMAANLSLQGGKQWPNMIWKWSLGASQWSQNDSKMGHWAPKKRMWRMSTKQIIYFSIKSNCLFECSCRALYL